MYRAVSTNGSQRAVSTNGTMYFTRAPDQGSCADKTPVIQGRKTGKTWILKKSGRDVYQLGHPCLVKTNINKKILAVRTFSWYISLTFQRAQHISFVYFSERSIYHQHILASIAYITRIFQRVYQKSLVAQHISLVYFSEHSIYHQHILASVAEITCSIAYITCIFQRAYHISLAYFSEHISLVYFSECSIYHLHILASVASINLIFQRAYHNISLVYFSERSKY